jgi:FAD/FMN-containing dehydrogenase
MVATNAAGPRTVRYGSIRRWVEGLEVVEVDGTVRSVKRGEKQQRLDLTPEDRQLITDHFPKTRKSSSGYALDRFAESGDEIDLLVGSEGTLAIVTAVQWRLDPIPPDVAGAALGFADLASMAEAVPYLVSLQPSALELLDETLLQFVPDAPRVACLLLVEFERETAAAARGVVGDAVRGLKHAVTHVATAVNRAGLEQLWSVRRLASPALARLPPTRRSLQLVEDGCVPLSALGEYVADLRAAADRRRIPVAIFGHAGDGHVHVNALPDTTGDGWREALRGLFDDVTDLLIGLGGVPSGEHGVGRLRAGILERFYGAVVMQRFGDVKRAYDPLSILNPGVIIPATDWSPVAALKVGPGAAAIPEDIATRLREVERSAAWATPKRELAH